MENPGEPSSERAAADDNVDDPARIATVGARVAGQGVPAGDDHAGDAAKNRDNPGVAINGGEVKESVDGGEGAAEVNNDEAEQQLQSQESADQPPPQPQHQPLPQDQMAAGPQRGGDNVSTALAHNAGPDNSNETGSDTRRASRAPNYTSAPATVLGNDSDRNDFIRGAPADDEAEGDLSEGGTAMNKLKKWFGGPSTTGTEPPERGHNDYHSFSSPNPSNHGPDAEDGFAQEASPTKKASNAKGKDVRSLSLDGNGYDESLLDDEEKGDVQLSHAPPESAWERAGSSSRPIPGTEEEERVMRESSFFYGAAGPHRARRIDPRAMARALRTGARRRWTERRYRRRLRQSQFRPHPVHAGENGEVHPGPEEFTYELTSEHRRAFLAAHTALNEKMANEYSRNRHAIRKQFGHNYEHDLDYDLELAEQEGGEGPEEIRADLTKSSLAIRGGLIRLPADNVRLVSDPQLQPGILSIETRDVSGGMVGYENYGNANRYGNINGMGVMRPIPESKEAHPGQRRRADSKESVTIGDQLQRHELAYVLTVDEQIYQRVVREMGDSYRIPCGMYYCCHGDEGGDFVGIGVAVVLLMIVFAFLIAAIIDEEGA